MPVQIGQPVESNFRDPLGLLSDCHRRIELFLNVLLTVSRQANGGELSGEQQESLAFALRYFRDAAPLHTLDEEDSLFPRMRKNSNEQHAAKLAKLDELHEEHRSAGDRHRRIDELGIEWLKTGKLSANEARQLNELLEDLSRMYADHILIEERDVFPFAATLLDDAEIRAIAQEMASRRGLTFDSQTP